MKLKMFFAAVVALTAGIYFGCSEKTAQSGFTGVVDGTITNVPALTGGKILSIRVEEGDFVSRGDTIAIVDTAALNIQKSGIRASLNEVAIQRSIAKTRIAEALDDSAYIQQRYDRIAHLYRSNSIPRQKLDDIANRRQQVNTALVQARQNLRLLASRRRQLLARLAELEKKIHDATVVTPTSGQVSVKYFERGEAAPPLSPVVEVVEMDTVWVKIFVSGSMLPKIQYGQEVKVTADGLTAALTGTVSWISSKAEFNPKNILTPETRKALVYAVKILIPNKKHQLKHGMPVEVYF